MHFDIPVLLQAYQVSGQVAIRHFKHLFEVIEADLLIYHQYAHCPETDAVIEYLI